MTFVLSKLSLSRLEGVDPGLVAVVKLAITLTTQDFMVVQGKRTKVEMWANYGKGRTVDECTAKGVPAIYAKPNEAKVTWLNDPLKSNHRVMPDGFGRAVDLGTFPYGSDPVKYKAIWAAMTEAAKRLNVKIRSGIDWNSDGKPLGPGEQDLGHHELVS